jgi:septum formation protein
MLTDLIASSNASALPRLILASQSPRRRDIFETNLGFTCSCVKKSDALASGDTTEEKQSSTAGAVVEIIPSDYEENLDKRTYYNSNSVHQYPVDTSGHKAESVLTSLSLLHSSSASSRPTLVVAVDTVVVRDNVILEKPKSKADAVEMVASMGGQTVAVVSGVTLLGYYYTPNGEQVEFMKQYHASTAVKFLDSIPDECVAAYVETGEPLDKAGGFGIQGLGSSLIEKIDGCFFNVMGLPISVALELRKFMQLTNPTA